MMVIVVPANVAAAQSVSYETNNPATVKGDADKIVCQKQEKIGTRLAAKKVCLTVREWQAREDADREQTEGIQAGTRGCGEGVDCTPTGKPF